MSLSYSQAIVILSHINPVQSTLSHPIYFRSILILYSHFGTMSQVSCTKAHVFIIRTAYNFYLKSNQQQQQQQQQQQYSCCCCSSVRKVQFPSLLSHAHAHAPSACTQLPLLYAQHTVSSQSTPFARCAATTVTSRQRRTADKPTRTQQFK